MGGQNVVARVELGEHIMGARPLGSWIGGDPADLARAQARAITTEQGLQAATAAKQMAD